MAGASVEIGDVLAEKYRIERVIGQGGMGVVAAATHLQLDELVAIKFLLPTALEQPSLIARFNQEARAQIKIKSEHVARTIDVGTLANGAPYMVLEYLDGSDLARLLRQHGPMPIERTVDLMLQACEALAEAHALGIVHRDLKPANLFVTRRPDGSECLKILDFGISKFTDSSSGESMHLTRTNTMLGSPLYMSPEQLRSAKEVDGRSDIWSLGIIMFELLANNLPFYEETVAQLCVSVMIKPLPNIQELASHVPDDLKSAIETATAKELPRRFKNVAEFAAAIAPFGTADAERSWERVQRITDEMFARETARNSARAERALANTGVDGSDAAARRRRELQLLIAAVPTAPGELEHNETIEGTENDTDSGPPATVRDGRTARGVGGSAIGRQPAANASSRQVDPHTLAGVAERSPAAAAPRRWVVPLVAGAALLVGAGGVFWVVQSRDSGGDVVSASSSSAPPAVVSSASLAAPAVAAPAITSAPLVVAATGASAKPEVNPPASASSHHDASPAATVSAPNVRPAPVVVKSKDPTVVDPPREITPPAVVRKPKASGSVYGERE